MDVGLTTAVIFAAAWIGMGTVIALSPKQFIPPGAFLLMLLLIPLVPYLWIAGNPFLCVMFLGGVASLLRWPFYYIGRMGLRKIGVPIPKDPIEKTNFQSEPKDD